MRVADHADYRSAHSASRFSHPHQGIAILPPVCTGVASKPATQRPDQTSAVARPPPQSLAW
jgi:hypothetical protein